MADSKTEMNQTSKTKDGGMTTKQAGELGGNKVLEERGPNFYSEIGRKQGKDNNPGNFANRPKEEVQAAGRKGGKARGEDHDSNS